MPMILQTKIYSSLVYHNSFFLLFSGSTLFESVELAVFFQKEVMIYTAKGAKETCRPPADCIILSIGSVKVTKTIQGITIDSNTGILRRHNIT